MKHHRKPWRIALAACALILLMLPETALPAGTDDGGTVLDTARGFMREGNYYSAITECMRYQHLYPGGGMYAESMLLMGEAYYRGGNYGRAMEHTIACFERHRKDPEGEKALVRTGYMRLMSGSPLFAYRTCQQYDYLYPGGSWSGEVAHDLGFALALQSDFDGARRAADKYFEKYPGGAHTGNMRELVRLINEEEGRSGKSVALSVAGSVLIPGFGHFYTGKYLTGILSLLTNAALIYLIYDGYRDDNTYRMVFFGLAEAAVYQYSLVSAVLNVREYNSREPFYRSVRLAARSNF